MSMSIPATLKPTPTGLTQVYTEPSENPKSVYKKKTESTTFDSIPDALEAIARGDMVIVVDDENRENEGDLIFPADAATVDKLAFMVRYTSGYICCSIPEERFQQLHIPLMVENNTDGFRTTYGVTVDYRHHTTTGISAHDRCLTVRALADPNITDPTDFTRPGHMLPLRASKNGVLSRAGHTETALDLCRLAGRNLAGVLCELVNDDGTMKRRDDCSRFAKEHGLKLITIADLISYRKANNC
ncbi:hypothetical protein IWQ61_009639 [Dispira simplex]|nr:hypothetical protein IWQ61_009639 [Dispira simplex]